MYDLNELQAFVSVMKTGSLRKSAHKLGVSKSTLSRRISHLEGAVNQPLLRRQANQLLANESGIQFLPYAEAILKTALEGQLAIEELKDEVSGSITLYVHDALVRGWFSGLMFAFLERYPNINMSLKTGHGVSQGSVINDLSIWLGEPTDDRLRAEKIGCLSNGVYASPDYLNSVGGLQCPDDLNSCQWVDLLNSHDEEISLHHAIDGIVSFRLPASRLVVDQHTLQADAVVKGKGVGVLSNYMVAKRLEHHPGVLVRCLDGWQADATPVCLQYPFGHLPKKLQVLIQYLREEGKVFF